MMVPMNELVADRHGDGDGLLRPVVPLEDVQVGPANAGAVDANEHVARADFGLRDVFELEDLGSSQAVDADGIHGFRLAEARGGRGPGGLFGVAGGGRRDDLRPTRCPHRPGVGGPA